MGKLAGPRHDDTSAELHPLIYRIVIGLVALWTLSAWGFAKHGYTSLVLAVVTLFGIIVVLIPFELWRIWRNHSEERLHDSALSFREWLGCEFDTWQEQIRGADAAITLLLPLAAVSIGALIFAIVFRLVAP